MGGGRLRFGRRSGLTPTTPAIEFAERGITYLFDTSAPVGAFVSGDSFAIDAVVVGTDPPSGQYDGTYSNDETFTDVWSYGLEIDPGSEGGTGSSAASTPQGMSDLPPAPSEPQNVTEFDYDHALNKDPAVTGPISGVHTLVKTLSILEDVDSAGREKLSNVSVLTILDEVPPAGSFRRWAGSADKTPIFFASDVDWSLLPSLTMPVGATLPDAADLIAKLGPLQTYKNAQLFARGIAPTGVQSAYGADIANDEMESALYTMTAGVSESDRNAVGYRLIQIGLDLYDAYKAGRRWSGASTSYGGGYLWLKIPIFYAARLLRNAANVTARNELIEWCDKEFYAYFQEDACTFQVTREQIESTPFESLLSRLWPQGYPNWIENSVDWLSKPSSTDKVSLSYNISYRDINGYPFITGALIVRLLGGEAIWNNPTYFEYCDTFYNKWVQRGRPTDTYFYPYSRYFVTEYYEDYSPAYSDATPPTLARRAARDSYAWMEFDENFDLAFQPAATDLTVTVAGSPVTLTSVSTTCSGTLSTGSSNRAEPTITVASATGIVVGQRVSCASLPANTFVIRVTGTSVVISEYIAATFNNVAVTFQNVFVFDRAMVAVLPTVLADDTVAVTIGYTAPGAGYVRNLGGTGLATVAVDAATNYTGVLPDGPSSKEAAYAGPTSAPSQYSGTNGLRSETIKRLRGSVRFVLHEAMANGSILLSSFAPSTTRFELFVSGTTGLRILIGGSEPQQIRAPGVLSGLPLDTLLTLHWFFDGTQVTQSAAKKMALVWDGGGNDAVDVSTSTGTLTGAWTGNIATILTTGLYAFADGSGNDPANISQKEINLGWGDETLPLPANLAGAEFGPTADWGPNGAGPWGQNQLYYAGPISEWNGGLPNRGNYGSLSLNAQRFLIAGDPDTPLEPEYVVYS